MIPFISIPFIYLTTIFHEVSHGIAALVSGGQIIEFAVALDGSGHLISSGGNAILITFSGYFGAPLWGACLFLSAHNMTYARVTLGMLLIMFLILLLFWVADILTVTIVIFVALLLSLTLRFAHKKLLNHAVRLIAIVVLFNGIYGPLYLLAAQRGDSMAMANLTATSPFVWVLIWLVWGVFLLTRLWPARSVLK